MKKMSLSKSRKIKAQDMLPEYNFDYSKARPNRFAGRISEERLVVLLDPEVSQVFTTPEAVNTVLRALWWLHYLKGQNEKLAVSKTTPNIGCTRSGFSQPMGLVAKYAAR